MKDKRKTKISSEQDQTKISSERLIKRKWWKIIIIVSIVVILLIGLTIGLVYVFMPEKNRYEKVATKINFTSKMSNITDDIYNEDEEDEPVAIFFYSKDDPIANYMFLDKISSEDEEGIGPLTEESEESDWKWYAVELPKENNLAEELFVDESDGEHKFYAQIETSIASNTAETIYINSADGTDKSILPSKQIEKSSAISFQFKIETNYDDEDNPYSIQYSFNNGEYSEYVIQSGTTMWFNTDGTINTIIDSWLLPIEGKNNTWYSDWFGEIKNYE